MFEDYLKKIREHFRNDLDHHKEVEGSYLRMEDWLLSAYNEGKNDNKSNS